MAISTDKTRSSPLRAAREAGAGLLLLALAGFAVWQTWPLKSGSFNQLGPGMLPRILAVMIAICGLSLLIRAFINAGAGLARWSLRGPLCILGAACAFALTVRPLGLAVAGPLAIMIGALASPESRWRELAIFTVVLTAFCIGLFKFALRLPIPLAPWLFGY